MLLECLATLKNLMFHMGSLYCYTVTSSVITFCCSFDMPFWIGLFTGSLVIVTGMSFQ